MKISKRLEAISSLIPDNVNVFDIGCDHAYLDIYLTLNRKNIKCTGIDISSSSIEKAKKNIHKFGLDNKIDLYVNDGLKNINVGANDYVVISGMGTYNILKIISGININNLILQTNTDVEFLIKQLDNYKVLKQIEVEEYKKYIVLSLIKKI